MTSTAIAAAEFELKVAAILEEVGLPAYDEATREAFQKLIEEGLSHSLAAAILADRGVELVRDEFEEVMKPFRRESIFDADVL